jgi:hypothetical protein
LQRRRERNFLSENAGVCKTEQSQKGCAERFKRSTDTGIGPCPARQQCLNLTRLQPCREGSWPNVAARNRTPPKQRQRNFTAVQQASGREIRGINQPACEDRTPRRGCSSRRTHDSLVVTHTPFETMQSKHLTGCDPGKRRPHNNGRIRAFTGVRLKMPGQYHSHWHERTLSITAKNANAGADSTVNGSCDCSNSTPPEIPIALDSARRTALCFDATTIRRRRA